MRSISRSSGGAWPHSSYLNFYSSNHPWCIFTEGRAPIFLANATLNRRKTEPNTPYPLDANFHDLSNIVSAKAPCPAPSRSEKALRSLLTLEFSRSRIGLRDQWQCVAVPPGSWCACALCFVVARLGRRRQSPDRRDIDRCPGSQRDASPWASGRASARGLVKRRDARRGGAK